jgi:NAD(P)-dependent dehydrogenase (short-subunit alcohol dehydrogenase family)
MRLEGNVAIVTGAGQGIGEAYARRFAKEGARVAVVDVNREKGEAVAEAIRDGGGEAAFVPCDVSSEDDTRRMAKEVADRWGRIDTLLNNAAIFYGIDNLNYSFEYLKKIFSVNYFGAWLCCRAAFPYMKRQGKGSVINQTSTAAYLHFPMPLDEELASFHYSVTKAAINGMTHFMAGAVGLYGIRVNAIAPGPTMTEATKQGVPQEILDMIVNMMMSIKRPLEPEDLTGTAVWLASDDSAMVTGQIICCDGGMVMLG